MWFALLQISSSQSLKSTARTSYQIINFSDNWNGKYYELCENFDLKISNNIHLPHPNPATSTSTHTSSSSQPTATFNTPSLWISFAISSQYFIFLSISHFQSAVIKNMLERRRKNMMNYHIIVIKLMKTYLMSQSLPMPPPRFSCFQLHTSLLNSYYPTSSSYTTINPSIKPQ